MKIANHVTIVGSTLLILLSFSQSGCEKSNRTFRPVTAQHDDSEFLLALVVDLSSSFKQKMAEEGAAYDFTLAVLEKYFRTRSSQKDKLILAQISGTQESLLWEGSPLELRRRFPSAETFRDFLLQNADPNGSEVNAGVANVVDYVAARPRVRSGQTRSAVFVLSDLEDTALDPFEGEQRLMQSLAGFAQSGGAVGLYYVNQTLVADWQQKLQAAGFNDYCVECEIVGQPALPDFD